MNLYFRLIIILFRCWLQSKAPQPIQANSKLQFRVWPLDLDILAHVNNGRYLTLMDLGRTDWLGQTGILGSVLKNKWLALLGGAHIIYKKPVKLFDKIELTTKVCYWDEKWIYFEQIFTRQEKQVAVGLVKFLLRDGDRNIPPEEWLALAGEVNKDGFEMSAHSAWHELETFMLN